MSEGKGKNKQTAAMKMNYRFEPLNENQAKQICAWKYERPYHIYEFGDWEDMAKTGTELADADVREQQYRAVLDEHGSLCGFAQFFPLEGLTRIGLGLRPDLCGNGLGKTFVREIVKEAQRKAPSNDIDLEVLAWNLRAYKVYEQCGFVYEQTYTRLTPTGPAEFHCMVYQSDANR